MSQAIRIPDEDRNAICVVVSGRDGLVAGQSPGAQSLLGCTEEETNDPEARRPCWALMYQVPGADQLPCMEDCANERLPRETSAESHSVRLRGRTFELRCEPVGEQIITTLRPLPDPPPSNAPRLTPRELEVLRLLAEGLDGNEIAEALGIRAGTVRTHVEHMRESLGCRTRAGLVAKGYRLRFLD